MIPEIQEIQTMIEIGDTMTETGDTMTGGMVIEGTMTEIEGMMLVTEGTTRGTGLQVEDHLKMTVIETPTGQAHVRVILRIDQDQDRAIRMIDLDLDKVTRMSDMIVLDQGKDTLMTQGMEGQVPDKATQMILETGTEMTPTETLTEIDHHPDKDIPVRLYSFRNHYA